MIYKAINDDDGVAAEVYNAPNGAFKIVFIDTDADQVIVTFTCNATFIEAKEKAEKLVGFVN